MSDNHAEHLPVTAPEPAAAEEEDRSLYSVKQTRTHEFLAWAGTRDQLIRIFDEAQNAMKKAFVTDKEKIGNKQPYEQESMLKAYTMTATVGGKGDLERHGDIRAILDRMDVREVEWVTMTNNYSPYSDDLAVSIKFPKETHTGPTLAVSGSNPDWVTSTFSSLSDLVSRDVPRWSILLRPFVSSLILGPFVVVITLVLYARFPESFNIAQSGLLLFLVPVVIITIIGNVLWSIAQRKLLRFELLGIGAKSSGHRLGGVALVVVTLLGLGIGILQFL